MTENNYDKYKDFELIELFCENNKLSYEPYYSGGGMFGRDCVGFVTNNPLRDYGNLAIFMNEMGRELPDYVSMDSMGNPTIIYWSSIRDTRRYDKYDNVVGYDRLEVEERERRGEDNE